jgi:4-hydroxy-4-methyl-2-oxoglutarate aldolase
MKLNCPLNRSRTLKAIRPMLAGLLILGSSSASAQVRTTKDQIMFYTADWKGDRYPDGRPKLPDDLLKRAVDVTIEDIWDYLRQKGYRNQFESGCKPCTLRSPLPDVL